MVFTHESIGTLFAIIGFALWAPIGLSTYPRWRVPIELGAVALWCSVAIWFWPAFEERPPNILVVVPIAALWWAVSAARRDLIDYFNRCHQESEERELREAPHDVPRSSVIQSSLGIAPGETMNLQALEAQVSASIFLNSALSLDDGGAFAPQYVLLIHAIELALKGVLLSVGITEDQLRKNYGHNLQKLLREARSQGLQTSDPETDGIVARLVKGADKARIRYQFQFDMPLIEDVRNVAQALINDTGRLVHPTR